MSLLSKNPSSRFTLNSWKTLSIREQVGQTSVLNLSAVMPLIQQLGAREFMERFPVGGFFVGGEVIADGSNSYGFVAEIVADLKACSRIPLLIAADLENGCGDVLPGLTPLPFPLCLAATDDESLAYDYGKACALEGALVGINWNYSPLVDLNLHPLSANIGNRGMGDSVEKVIRLGRRLIKGMQENGMAACAKTFPGDGADFRDQHLVTTENGMSEDVWWKIYGHLFEKIISDGVGSMMTGHFTLPAFQGAEENGLPSTLSYAVTMDLLKRRMGFDGLVVSDAFGMAGILKWGNKDDVCVRSMAVGSDMVLFNSLSYLDRMEAAMAAEEVTEERLNDALARIWTLKEDYACSPQVEAPIAEQAKGFALELGKRVAVEGLTEVNCEAGSLPLDVSKDKRLCLIAVTPYDKAYRRFARLAESLEASGFSIDFRRNCNSGSIAAIARDYDRIIYLVERQFHRPLGLMDFSGEESHSVWAALTVGREKSVVINFGSPFLSKFYFDRAPALFNAYSSVPFCVDAVCDLLLGNAKAPGVSPVDLDTCCSVVNAGAVAQR
ncbi:hypothetical protein MLD52_00485 [Puniceicoccaceae bacterium K14]|nr:hypothetical protein [Puniceicoccaceae bacterium K14]